MRDNELVLRYSVRFLIYNGLLFAATLLVFWANFNMHLLTAHLQIDGFDWRVFWLLFVAPLGQGLLLISAIFWRLKVDEHEIISTRIILADKVVNLNDITHIVEKESFFFTTLDIIVGKKRFARVLASSPNYNELHRRLKALNHEVLQNV